MTPVTGVLEHRNTIYIFDIPRDVIAHNLPSVYPCNSGFIWRGNKWKVSLNLKAFVNMLMGILKIICNYFLLFKKLFYVWLFRTPLIFVGTSTEWACKLSKAVVRGVAEVSHKSDTCLIYKRSERGWFYLLLINLHARVSHISDKRFNTYHITYRHSFSLIHSWCDK